MANVIQLKSGQTETVFDLEDLLRLVEEHMGDETRRLLEDFTAPPEDQTEYIDYLETENRQLRDHHHEVMTELRSLFESEARLIQEKEINRKALSTIAGTDRWSDRNACQQRSAGFVGGSFPDRQR